MRRSSVLALVVVLVLLVAGCSSTSTSTSTATAGPGTSGDRATSRAADSAPTTGVPKGRGSTSSTAKPGTPPTGTWTSVDPTVAGVNSQLTYTQCNGADDCWAVGFRNESAGAGSVNFLEHWDGAAWKATDSPAASGPLGELDCLPDGFCVVPVSSRQLSSVGSLDIDRFVDGAWTPMKSNFIVSNEQQSLAVFSVSCYSETFCAAVGRAEDAAGTHASPLAAIWDGTNWRSTEAPIRGTDPIQILASVSCTSASWCMAVGSTAASSSSNGDTPTAARWNGTGWEPVPVPEGRSLDNVVCVSESFCIAVGAPGAAGADGRILRWDGRSWTAEESPLTGPYRAVNCSSEDLCMAVRRPLAQRPLSDDPGIAVRWHGQWYEVTGYPAPASGLNSVSCYADGCLAVGWARSKPSTSAADVDGAQASAAFWDLSTVGSATTGTTR